MDMMQAAAVDHSSAMTAEEMLAVMNKHAVAELAGDFPTVFSTLAPEPRYSLNGKTFTGRERVEIWYRDIISNFFNADMFELRRTVVGTRNLVHDVVETLTLRGQTFKIAGVSIVDFEDGLIKGENYYLPPPFEDVCNEYYDMSKFFDGTWL
jgi:hypothetical protein